MRNWLSAHHIHQITAASSARKLVSQQIIHLYRQTYAAEALSIVSVFVTRRHENVLFARVSRQMQTTQTTYTSCDVVSEKWYCH